MQIIQERDIMENNPLMPREVLISDKAETEIDDFKRKPFAREISNIIASRRNPSSIVIGIYGKWGEGKTTVLNFIQKELEKYEDIICIQYNPWYYSDEVTLLRNFFDNLANELGKLSSSNGLVDEIKKYGKRISQISVSKSATVNLGIVQLDVEADSPTSNSFLDLLKAKNTIQEMLKQHNIRIVVLMDDIDRLDKTEIQYIFKLVKLSADFNYLNYVLAFDEEMVASALGEKYGSSDIESGRNFLEKIINVPLHLPKASETALSNFLYKGIINNVLPLVQSGIKEEDYSMFCWQFESGIQIRLKTPRMAKRYQNSLVFALPILKDEVNIIDLMLIEGIRIFYPKMYTVIKNNAEIFINSKSLFQKDLKETPDIIKNVLIDLSIQEQESLKHLLSYLFPRAQNLLQCQSASYPIEDYLLLARKRRISSPHYFNRYFSYTVPTGDISDIEISSFIEYIDENEDLNDKEIERILSQIMSIIDANGPESLNMFILKIIWSKHKLNFIASQKMVLAISKIWKNFPDSSSLYLIDELLQTMPPEIMSICSRKVIESTSSICFALYIYDIVQKEEMKLSHVDIEYLKNSIKDKILDKFTYESEPIYVKCPCTRLVFRLLLDSGCSEKLSKYIEGNLSLKPDYSLKFLVSFCDTRHSANGSYKKFSSDGYDSIKELIDPNILCKVLHDIYADILEAPTIKFDDTEETRILKNFSLIHNERKKSIIKNDGIMENQKMV